MNIKVSSKISLYKTINIIIYITHDRLWLYVLGPLFQRQYIKTGKTSKRAARIILNAHFMTPSRLMFSELKWLTFPKRVDYHTCTMVYKALNNLAPNYICERFIMTSNIHSRNLRSVDNKMLHIPSFKTSCYGNSFTISAEKLWNKIPYAIRISPSLTIFKSAVKSFLLSN